MDSFEKAHLKKKYGWTGQKYQDLITKILVENHKKISDRVMYSDKKRFERNLKLISPKRDEKRIKLPDPEKIVKYSQVIKSAQSGHLLTKTFKNRLRDTITKTLEENKLFTKKGAVSKTIAKKVKKNLELLYNDYTAKNPKTGIPNNLVAIARTETMSIVNTTRNEYIRRINQETQNDYKIVKKWIHNHSMSDQPRAWHEQLSRTRSVGYDSDFVYKNNKGQTFRAKYPHDPRLPASESINCMCEIQYTWIKKK